MCNIVTSHELMLLKQIYSLSILEPYNGAAKCLASMHGEV
jgi:hypothetical protein